MRRMDTFSHLMVLPSIIVGLGVANVLTAFAGMIHHRERLRFYWPVMVWLLVIFLAFVQTWWVSLALTKLSHPGFMVFASTAFYPVLPFILSAILAPDFSGGDLVDMRADFFKERRWFFGLLLATAMLSFLGVVFPPYLGIKYAFATALYVVFTLLGLVSANERLHRILAGLALIGYSAAVVVLALP